MSTSKPIHRQMHFAVLLLALPALAFANADSNLTSGSGPDGYRSYTFTGNADITGEVELNLDYFRVNSSVTDDMREVGAGLTWYATDLVSANYRYSDTNDGTVEVKGNEGGLSLALDTLWQGDLKTSLDLGYGVFKYSPANPKPVAVDRTLTQNRSTIGLSQDLASFLTVYASHDKYKYDKNVTALAFFLLKRLHYVNRAFTLLAFPDKTNTFGMTWKTTDALSLDLSSAKTTTLLEQEQKSTKIAVDYRVSDSLSFAAAVTRVSSSAVMSSLGVVVQPATQDTYTEFSLGWGF